MSSLVIVQRSKIVSKIRFLGLKRTHRPVIIRIEEAPFSASTTTSFEKTCVSNVVYIRPHSQADSTVLSSVVYYKFNRIHNCVGFSISSSTYRTSLMDIRTPIVGHFTRFLACRFHLTPPCRRGCCTAESQSPLTHYLVTN